VLFMWDILIARQIVALRQARRKLHSVFPNISVLIGRYNEEAGIRRN